MLLLLLLLCGSFSVVAHAAEYGQSYEVLTTGSLKPEGVCYLEPLVTPLTSTQFRVPLNHRHGPCSPVPSGKKPPRPLQLLDGDKLRADYIRRKFSNESSAGGAKELAAITVPTILGTYLDTLEYVITVRVGSPAVKQTMIIDTGSDVSWVHCNPHSPFNPGKSRTYTAFSCSSAECAMLGQNTTCSSSECRYAVRYGDGSNSTGTYGSDVLALPKSAAFRKFRFGCSSIHHGFSDKTNGIIGLGGNTESLVSQTAGTYGRSFSYCLPKSSATYGFLTLGARRNTKGFVTMQMLRSKHAPTFYMVPLQGIAVDGKLLSIPPTVFSAGHGTILDSGTVITRLPPTAYSALKSA